MGEEGQGWEMGTRGEKGLGRRAEAGSEGVGGGGQTALEKGLWGHGEARRPEQVPGRCSRRSHKDH